MAEKKQISIRQLFSQEEIQVRDLMFLVTSRKRLFYITFALFMGLGILVAITTPVQYQSEVKILSEGADPSASAGGLSGLAGLAGVSIPSGGSASSALGPTMYGTIANSQPFLMDLMNEKFFFKDQQKELTLYEYIGEERPGDIVKKTYQLIGKAPKAFYSLFEKKKVKVDFKEPEENIDDPTKKIVKISKNQEYVLKELASKIEIEIAGRIVTIRGTMPDPVLSAEFSNLVLRKIMDYVITYNTKKQRDNLKYIEERSKEAEATAKDVQLKLAAFQDANRGVVSKTALTKELQLQEEYKLAFGIYSKLALEYEQTKIALKKETPLFSEFQPASVPLDIYEPDIPIIFAIYFTLGIVFGGFVIVFSIVRAYVREGKKTGKASVLDEAVTEEAVA